MKPSGSIQNPRIGRKPNIPPKTNPPPSAIRPALERGIGIRREPMTRCPVRWSIPNRALRGVCEDVWVCVMLSEMGINIKIASECNFFEKIAWQIEAAFVLGHSRRSERLIPGSSAVEHSTVNRQVAGSNPARGASFKGFAFIGGPLFVSSYQLRLCSHAASSMPLSEFFVHLSRCFHLCPAVWGT